ncbi:hypothetical protein H2248_001800 [Termitomyces sp. 'cryptogamus']|nr:hypothetical protein H2248_001800 [Termitomyces sp. 'cryptogamus']
MSSADAQQPHEQQTASPTADDAEQAAVDNRNEHSESSSDDKPTTTDHEEQSQQPTPWQAIYSPQYNAYYFFNAETQETTWNNPLAPASQEYPASSQDSVPSTSTALTNPQVALEAAAIAAGIDPSLAYLDPTLLASVPGTSVPSAFPPAFTAKFNARTGQFTRPDARDPSHLSEHARAARMSEFYFDVNAWENQLAEQGGSIMGPEGKKRKRPSKKDLVCILCDIWPCGVLN